MLDLADHLAHHRFFGLVAGIDRQPQRDALGIKQKAHSDNRAMSVLLGGALSPQAAFEIDLEEEIGAVEVGRRRVSAEHFCDSRVVYLDDFAVLLPEKRDPIVELIEGVRGVRPRKLGQSLGIGFKLRARRYRACVGQIRQQPV